MADARRRTLTDAVSGGDYRMSLIALKNKLAQEIDASNSGRDIAALSRQLTYVLQELEMIPEKEDASNAERIRQARAARLASSSAGIFDSN